MKKNIPVHTMHPTSKRSKANEAAQCDRHCSAPAQPKWDNPVLIRTAIDSIYSIQFPQIFINKFGRKQSNVAYCPEQTTKQIAAGTEHDLAKQPAEFASQLGNCMPTTTYTRGKHAMLGTNMVRQLNMLL